MVEASGGWSAPIRVGLRVADQFVSVSVGSGDGTKNAPIARPRSGLTGR